MEHTYKFNKNCDTRIEDLSGTKVYQIREKLNNKQKLTREEKNWVTKKMYEHRCLYSFGRIALMGWYFLFDDVCTKYVVKQHDDWFEVWGMDKTSVRAALYGTIQEIVEIPKKKRK